MLFVIRLSVLALILMGSVLVVQEENFLTLSQ